MTKKHTYYELNNMLNQPNDKGEIQLDKDKEAAKVFFIDHVNQNTVFFHSLKEKLDYLVDNDYIDGEILDNYSYQFIKKLFKRVYAKKHRFNTFMGAYKFYRQYALKTNDGKRYLERYEDRISFNALTFGNGNEELAIHLADEMINRRYQPATPTFLNAGRKRRGEFVSCFLVRMEDNMNSIGRTINSALQLSKIGGGVGILLTDLRPKGSTIKGIENAGSGVVPVMKVLEDSFKYANQLGQRQGAGAVYLNIFHQDILDFLATRKENADDAIRVKMLSLGLVVPDKFYELVEKDEVMHLFNPQEILEEYGVLFSQFDITERYDELVSNPNLSKTTIKARDLDTEISKLQQESGYPYIMNYDTVNRENLVDGTISMSNLCVTGDTELLTDKGYFKAKELYELQNDLTVQIDNRTKTFNQNSKGISLEKAIPMQLTQKKADVYEVKTKQGFSIKSTAWHKYYVLKEDGSIKKVSLSELSIGDKLLVQSGVSQSHGDNYDTDVAYIMGVIAGDGTLYERKASSYARIILHNDKKQFEDKILHSVHNIIKKHGHEFEFQHNSDYAPLFVRKEQDGKEYLSLQSAVLGKILKDKFNYSSKNKLSVPDYVKHGSKHVKQAFLSGLFQMDGCINANPKYMAMSIELVTINNGFAKDIQKTLLELGVFSTIYKRKERIGLLPDENRELKETKCSATYRVTIQDRHSRDVFMKNVELKEKDKIKYHEFNKILSPKSRTPKHKYTAVIESIDYIGKEDVYDTTQETYHSLIFNGIVTGNCSEILQVQTPSEINDDQTYKVLGKDISCNLGSLNIPNLMKITDKGGLYSSIGHAMQALTYIADTSDIKTVPTVRNGNDASRSVGLGAMGLHTYFATLGVQYGSPESVEITDKLFEIINYASLFESCWIAKETQEAFVGFEKSKYADGSYFDKYINRGEHTFKYDITRKIFEHLVPTQKDWISLANDVKEYGLYHQNRLAVAPNGSISYVNETSSSLHPITHLIEKRQEGKTGSTFYPAPLLSNETLPYYKSAYDTSMLDVIDVYASAQKHVDQGMSLTLFMRSEIPAGLYPWKKEGGKLTTRDLSLIRHYAWKKGIKTIYYVRTFTEDEAEVGINQCESCSV